MGSGAWKLIQAPSPPGICDLRTLRTSLWPLVTILSPSQWSNDQLASSVHIQSGFCPFAFQDGVCRGGRTMMDVVKLPFPAVCFFQELFDLFNAFLHAHALIAGVSGNFRTNNTSIWREHRNISERLPSR